MRMQTNTKPTTTSLVAALLILTLLRSLLATSRAMSASTTVSLLVFSCHQEGHLYVHSQSDRKDCSGRCHRAIILSKVWSKVRVSAMYLKAIDTLAFRFLPLYPVATALPILALCNYLVLLMAINYLASYRGDDFTVRHMQMLPNSKPSTIPAYR